MSGKKIQRLFTTFHAGRGLEFFYATVGIAAAFTFLSLWGTDWFFPDLIHYAALFALMLIQATNSVLIIKYHVSPSRWWASGVISAVLLSALFSAIAFLILVLTQNNPLGNAPFESYVMRIWRFMPYGFVTEQSTFEAFFSRIAGLAPTFFGMFCINLSVALSGMGIGAIKRSYGAKGVFATMLSGIALVAVIVWVGSLLWNHSIPAPWPGIFLFTIPLILLAIITARVAATKQSFGNETRAV